PQIAGGTLGLGAIGLTASAGLAGWVEFLLLRTSLGSRIGGVQLALGFQLRLWLSAIVGAAVATGADRLYARLAAGERVLRAAVALDPAFYPALKNLGVNEYDAGHDAEARSHFERVLRLAPGDEIAHLYLAEIDYRAKRGRESIAHYEKTGTRFAQDPAWAL